jgi:hypothetical protein
MGGPAMNGLPHQQGMPNMGANPGMNMLGQMGVPQMGAAIGPGMNHPGPGGMMGAPMAQVSLPHNADVKTALTHLTDAVPSKGGTVSTKYAFPPQG